MSRDRHLALGYLHRSKSFLGTAERALSDGDFAHAVFNASASTELSVKAALLAVGEGHPKDHDAGDFLRGRRRRFPEAYREEVGRWASANTRLAKRGEESRYGDPASGRTAEESSAIREKRPTWLNSLERSIVRSRR